MLIKMAETLKKIRRDMSSTERNDKFFPATNQVAMPYSLRRRARACFGARRARLLCPCAPLTPSPTSAPATLSSPQAHFCWQKYNEFVLCTKLTDNETKHAKR